MRMRYGGILAAACLLLTASATAQQFNPAAGVARPGPGRLHALEYGVSASAADNTGAIQAAIDACQAAGGGIVQLPAGVLRVTGTLRMASSHVWLRGAGEPPRRCSSTMARPIASSSATGSRPNRPSPPPS